MTKTSYFPDVQHVIEPASVSPADETMSSTGVQHYIDRGVTLTATEANHRARMRARKFDTIAVHGIYSMQAALANQGSIIEPVYLSSAQHFENSDHMEAALAYLTPSWTYTRIANPTVHYLEQTLAMLEGYEYTGATTACVTGSGMSAIFMATNPFLMRVSGDNGRMNIVASAKCYGGTFVLFSQRYAAERHVEVRWVRDPQRIEEWASQIDADTRFVYAELPSNPGLAVFDLAALAKVAHSHAIPLIVDSTVATPALLRPFNYGADIVVHSLSKNIATSGLVIAGAVIARHNIPSRVGPEELRADFARYIKLLPYRDHGPALSPFNALMILNDIRTLRSRMDYISRSTLQIATFLAQHPQVEAVAYPGLPGSPGHQAAARLMWLADGDESGRPTNRFGALLSFTVKGGAVAARAVFDRLQLIWRATDLGRIKSVATIPAISTHQQQGDAGRVLGEIPAHLIRLSVGGEHPADLIDDLSHALGHA